MTMIEFIDMKRASNGEYRVTFSRDNGYHEIIWLTELHAQLLLSAQRLAKNSLRKSISDLLRPERLDGYTSV
jgi:uncharacterized protein YegP (UPF0339 family)